MYQLYVKNAIGEMFDLTNSKADFYVLSVQGLTVPEIKVNTKEFAGFDGSFYNSSKVGERNIVINFLLNGDIEASRQKLYRIFLIKRELTLYFKNKYRSLTIKGYPESIDGDLFVEREQIQVSIICPRPFFEAENSIEAELSDVINGLQFPLSIDSEGVSFSELYEFPLVVLINPGDVSCGAIITMQFLEVCRIPTIINVLTGDFLRIDTIFAQGDKVTICTIPGKLSVVRYSAVTGKEKNILGYFTNDSGWLTIAPGRNIFKFEDDDGNEGYNVKLEFKISPLFGGV